MLQVNITSKCVFDDSRLVEHIRENQRLHLPDIIPAPAHDRAVAMCASGPSLKSNLAELKSLGLPIVASNGAHDYLIEQGFKVDYACAVDPTDIQRFKLKNHETFYFLASQCNPKLFEDMQGYNVAIFNVAYSTDKEAIEVFGPHPIIGGGSTTGLKAIALFYMCGFRTFHLFGYDGSFEGDLRRVTGETVPENSMYVHPAHHDAKGEMVISPNEYYSCPEMAIQATELSIMMNSMMPDANVIPYGDGLIQETLRMRKNLGDTADFRGVRQEATAGLHGTPTFDIGESQCPGFDFAPIIESATHHEAGSDGLHL